MNIVFWILTVAFLIFIWFILAFLFQPLGKFFRRVWDDAIEEIKKEDEEK